MYFIVSNHGTGSAYVAASYTVAVPKARLCSYHALIVWCNTYPKLRFFYCCLICSINMRLCMLKTNKCPFWPRVTNNELPGKLLTQPRLGENRASWPWFAQWYIYMLYGFILLLCFADGAEIADQPDVVLYAAVDKSAFQKNQNKADVVAEAVPEKKGIFFSLSFSLSFLLFLGGFFWCHSLFIFYNLINIALYTKNILFCVVF